ncbi:hypothetical protein PG991_014393 [Apiospora marii]|uniref:Uncharacterized protein n=1 Tax=Apiospora marii TaxID=335849 RepID=A0ABR1R8S2_9PEZI
MGRNQPYCCICGAPMVEAGQRDDEPSEWLTRAILLTTAHSMDDDDNNVQLDVYWLTRGRFLDLGPNPPKDSTRRVLELDAQCDDNNRFQILKSGETVEAFYVRPDVLTPGPNVGGPLYMAVHAPCITLARRFIESRGEEQQQQQGDSFHMGPDDEPRSIKQLWQVLHRRIRGTLPLVSEYLVEEPHDYFGGRFCRNIYWERDDDPEYGQLLEENPLEIADITESILQNLEPMPAESAEQQGSRQGTVAEAELPKSPGDLRHLDPACDYARSQAGWYDVLAMNQSLPWLWDLDGEVLHKKAQEGDWDWEHLVRRLAQAEIHEPRDKTLQIPLGLRNRRRIWRVLEEARVDDTADI